MMKKSWCQLNKEHKTKYNTEWYQMDKERKLQAEEEIERRETLRRLAYQKEYEEWFRKNVKHVDWTALTRTAKDELYLRWDRAMDGRFD